MWKEVREIHAVTSRIFFKLAWGDGSVVKVLATQS